MAKKVTKTFTATLALNPEKAGAWMAHVSLITPLQGGLNNLNSVPDSESQSAQAAWKNASAGKRWVKEQVLAMTPRKSVKMVATRFDAATDKPVEFTGVLEFKA